MFTCKQVSESLSKTHFHTLPKWKQCMIKMHVKLCVFCGKYNNQVIDSHTMCQHFKENEASVNCESSTIVQLPCVYMPS